MSFSIQVRRGTFPYGSSPFPYRQWIVISDLNVTPEQAQQYIATGRRARVSVSYRGELTVSEMEITGSEAQAIQRGGSPHAVLLGEGCYLAVVPWAPEAA